MVKMGRVALDGTKVRANASRHKAMSYDRMGEREERLPAEVADMMRKAQEVDDKEDAEHGVDNRGGGPPRRDGPAEQPPEQDPQSQTRPGTTREGTGSQQRPHHGGQGRAPQ